MMRDWKSRVDRWLGRFMDRYIAEGFEERLRQVVAVPGEFGVDPFGLDPDFLRYVAPVAWFLHRIYFRVQAKGLENIPEPGPVLFIANHSGQIPIDGLLVATTLLMDHDPPILVRSMVERWVPTLPYVSVFMARCGQVVGSPENCSTLLDQGEAILVFPEGVKGISKTWDRRYRLQEFGHGFMRLALDHQTPIVPVAIIGGEEQAPSFKNFEPLARLLGAPAFPLTPTFPWLGPAGLLPYPVRYRLHFGEPMYFAGDPTEDEGLLEQKVAKVRDTLQGMIRSGLQERRHVFW